MDLDVTKLRSRKEAWAALKAASADKPFDVLVIGGGGTGAGCALDAASRCAILSVTRP